MQAYSVSSTPLSEKTPSQLGNTLINLPTYLDSHGSPPERATLLDQCNLEGSIIWSRRLTQSLLSHKTKIYSNIKVLSKEDQAAIVLPFLRNNIWTNNNNRSSFVSPIISRKAHDLAYLFTSSRAVRSDTPELDLFSEQGTSDNLDINQDPSKLLGPGQPICLASPSVKNLVNLTNNLRRTYEKGSAFGSLEKAHLEWMENNEIRHDRVAHNNERKLDMYRNYIFQGSSSEARYNLIESFLIRKDLLPKKEPKSLIPASFNQTFNGMVDKCEIWYKQGQKLAAEVISQAKKAVGSDNKTSALHSVNVLEDQTITIDWDKALRSALRSHAIAQLLGIPPKVLFLTGFAAIDVKQIIMCQDLQDIEKLIYVAQIVLKTLLKIIVIVGTKVLTSAVLGFGGLDTITVPFGINGEAFLAHHITTRVVDAIDMQFDNMKVKMDEIADC